MEILLWTYEGEVEVKLPHKEPGHPREAAKTPARVRHGARFYTRGRPSSRGRAGERSLQNQGKCAPRLKLSDLVPSTPMYQRDPPFFFILFIPYSIFPLRPLVISIPLH